MSWPALAGAVLAACGLAACSPADQAQINRGLAPVISLQPRVGEGDERLDLPQYAAGLFWRSLGAQTAPARAASFAPVGQSAGDWREMIAAWVLPVGARPGDAAVARVRTLAPGCASSAIRWLSAPAFDGGFDVFVTCSRPPPRVKSRVALPRYEALWLRGVYGRRANYLIERHWRGDSTAGSVIDSHEIRSEWRDWFAYTGIAGAPRRRPPDPDAPVEGRAALPLMPDSLRGLSAQ